MSVRPAEAMLPPPPSEADRKAMRAFWRGLFIGTVFGFGLCGALSAVLS